MSEISVGDLVMVVRNHCGSEFVGEIHTAGPTVTTECHCGRCGGPTGRAFVRIPAIEAKYPSLGDAGFPPSYLKRIPPLEELEGEKREVKEPA